MRKYVCCAAMLFIGLLFSACDSDTDNTGNNGNNGNSNGNPPSVDVQTGRVTFFNESSYRVIVHQDAFSGPVLLELSAGESKRVDVRTSDNHGFGTTFSIEYLYKITEAFDADSGEVFASGIDPNVQINRVIEADKSYTIQIPQPQNLEFRTAFVKILNMNNLPFEFRYLGNVFRQAGNNNISVAPGRTGVYRIENIPANGRVIQNHELATTFAVTAIPDFTVMNGVIYTFTFDGSAVVKTNEQTIIFR